MSSPSPKSKAPIASRRKRAIHALYLAQPLLQFVALMAVLFVLNRCSPLAPSTDKGNKMLSASSVANQHSPQDVQAAEDNDIKTAMLPVSSTSQVSVLSQDDFESQIETNAINADSGGSLEYVENVFQVRQKVGARHGVRLLVLPLSKEQREEFFAKGNVRIDLGAALAPKMTRDVRHSYFGALRQLLDADLSAKMVLVTAETPAVNSLPVVPQVNLALFASEGKGWAQVSLDEQQQKLTASYKDKAAVVALVLE